MESFYIVSFQSKEILLSKEYTNNNNIEIVQEFLLNSEKILNLNSYSNFILLNNNLFFIFQIIDENMDIIFIIITNEDSIYIPSYLTILDNIINSLKYAFEASIDKNLIRDNIILILLMLQHYLNYGVPIYSDSYINSSLINPYKLTDKISEKIIGLAKIYNISTIKNYLQNLQLNLKNDNKFFYFDKNKEQQTPKILFDYIDKISLICDKKGNILNNKCFTEINVNSQVKKTFEISTLINIPFEFLSFSKDKLVKNNKKEIFKKKSFDAIIKHGHYSLMNFFTVLSNNFIQLPFKFKLENKNENSKIELLIEIEPNLIKEIKYELNNIKIVLNFNIDYDCSIKNINLSANEGEFEINEIKNEAIWKIKNFKDKIFLKGSVLINSKNNNDINNILNNYSILMNLSCEIEKYSISGGNLTKVNINDEELKNSINKYYKNKTIIKNLEVIF